MYIVEFESARSKQIKRVQLHCPESNYIIVSVFSSKIVKYAAILWQGHPIVYKPPLALGAELAG